MIEVGTNAYITEADYLAYANLRGITVNSATLESDIVLSADFINTYYSLKDGFSLPSAEPAKVTAISKPALKACEMQQAGLLKIDLAAIVGGIVSSESKSLEGVGSKSVSYEAGSRSTFKPRAPELDSLLRPFLAFSGGLVRV